MDRARRYTNKRGMEVLAITAPIYNEAVCYNAACHYHSAGQKVLGIMDLGLFTAPLQKNLALMRGRMIVFSIMVLILTVGGVAALLRRQIFIPLREITEFTSDINNGNLNRELKVSSVELSDLADDIQAVALQLRNAVEETEKLKKSQEQTKEKK
jgi:methyl-accepting chemotaxis protein